MDIAKGGKSQIDEEPQRERGVVKRERETLWCLCICVLYDKGGGHMDLVYRHRNGFEEVEENQRRAQQQTTIYKGYKCILRFYTIKHSLDLMNSYYKERVSS